MTGGRGETEEVVLSCEFWVLSCLSRVGAEESRETKYTRKINAGEYDVA
jgi:hypothetical protein